MVLKGGGVILLPGDICQCLETFLAVTAGEGMLLASRVEAENAAQLPTVPENHLVQNVSNSRPVLQ